MRKTYKGDPYPPPTLLRPLRSLRREWLHSAGLLVGVRYAVGRLHERLFGYEPDSRAMPFRVARAMRLSGY